VFFLKELPTQTMLQHYDEAYTEMEVESVGDALKMLRTASLLLRELEAYFAKNGMSQTRFLIMMVLDREQGNRALSISGLADRLDISRPIITNTVKALRVQNLVEVLESPTDGRSKSVALTRTGRRALHKMLPGYFTVITAFMGEID
jgi:DNA-binding MarR family transcriptional regulator